VLNVEDMGVGGIDTGSGEVWYIGDEHWDEGGEDDCEKTRCMSSRASPMSACSARNVAKVGAGVMSESVKRLNHSNTNKRRGPRKRKVEQLLFAKFAAHQTHPLEVNLANQDGMVQPVRRCRLSSLGTYYCNKYSGADPESSTMGISSANQGS
jgi:hypothetical protein